MLLSWEEGACLVRVQQAPFSELPEAGTQGDKQRRHGREERGGWLGATGLRGHTTRTCTDLGSGDPWGPWGPRRTQCAKVKPVSV